MADEGQELSGIHQMRVSPAQASQTPIRLLGACALRTPRRSSGKWIAKKQGSTGKVGGWQSRR